MIILFCLFWIHKSITLRNSVHLQFSTKYWRSLLFPFMLLGQTQMFWATFALYHSVESWKFISARDEFRHGTQLTVWETTAHYPEQLGTGSWDGHGGKGSPAPLSARLVGWGEFLVWHRSCRCWVSPGNSGGFREPGPWQGQTQGKRHSWVWQQPLCLRKSCLRKHSECWLCRPKCFQLE